MEHPETSESMYCKLEQALISIRNSPDLPWSIGGSRKIRYESPYVDRIWFRFMGGRLNLHRIYTVETGKTAFLHSHPWSSASIVMDGHIRHRIGSQLRFKRNPTDSEDVRTLVQGSRWSMTGPLDQHSVSPIGGPAYTLFYTGFPFLRSWEKACDSPGKEESLSQEEIDELYGKMHQLSKELLP